MEFVHFPDSEVLNLFVDEIIVETLENDNLGQGLTLVHPSAQPEPFLTQNTPYIPPNDP